MSSLSNAIAQMILDMLEETGDAEIQRNLLAQSLGCVRSQSNSVIASRFPPEQGYIVESRRGGGGCIRIRRVKMDRGTAFLALVNALGPRLDESTLRAHIANLYGQDFISEQAAALMRAAGSGAALRALPPPTGDVLRASIFKQMLLTLSR
ncbi:MAG: CtsR family transcriptional regulator [Oscillospiraceae bacterium]|jgi:transcriptional regulator CtsR|nr:CtsR family transcriptional regulator [Oscillospiraceae bacterium]